MQRIRMKITLKLCLILVTFCNGKVILSKDSNISNNVLTKQSETHSKESNDKVSNDKIINILPTKIKESENDDIINSKKSTECVHRNKNNDEIVDNIIDNDSLVRCDIPENIDNGTALILTSYIENGRIAEARNASKVKPSVFMGFESYSGYLTVDKTYDSNTFFWYFPVEKKNVSDTPWIIWLQGGPGVSSLFGLFEEIGPFRFGSSGKLEKNPYTWLRNHSLVFIDNPVGTGYSFTKNVDGLTRDMNTYGKHLYEALKQFLQIFPELRKAPLFVAGESYAGKYVPALAIEIHRHKNLPESDVNLKGVMIGNAYVDLSEIVNVTDLYLHLGLLTREQIKIVDPLQKAFQQEIANKNSPEAKHKWSYLIFTMLFLTHQKHAFNYLKDEIIFGRYVNYLDNSDIKRALHVGNIRHSLLNVTVNLAMSSDFLSSATPLFEELLDHYRVLAYCGQLDQMLPCVFASEHYRTWKWNGASEFLRATRHPYYFETRLAGYHKTGGGLTEVMIRGAGHLVPQDKPEPIQNLVARWTHDQPFGKHRLLNITFLQDFVRNNSVLYL